MVFAASGVKECAHQTDVETKPTKPMAAWKPKRLFSHVEQEALTNKSFNVHAET